MAVLYVAPPSVVVTWPSSAAPSPDRDVSALVFADVARVDFGEGRLLVTPAHEKHLVPFARAVGGALFANEGYYDLRPSFSFKTLQALGAHGFARLGKPAGVAAWSVVGCQWSGHDETIEARSGDALGSFDALTTVDGGYFPRVTIRVVPVETRARSAPAGPVDLFIQLPHRITVSDPRQEALVRAVGKALGILRAGGAPDDVRTLAPWVHFEWRWREVLGAEAFELLVRKKILVRVKAKKGAASLEHRLFGSSGGSYRDPGRGRAVRDPAGLQLAGVRREGDGGARLAAGRSGAHGAPRRGDGAARRERRREGDGGDDARGARGEERAGARDYAAGRPPKGLVAALRAACKLGATPVLCVPAGIACRTRGSCRWRSISMSSSGSRRRRRW